VLVGQLDGDGSGGEHDEGECGVGGVEAVGASHDETDLGVQPLNSSEGHSFNYDAVGRTAQSAQRCTHLEAPRSQVEVTPARLDWARVVAEAGLEPTMRTDETAPTQRDGDRHRANPEPDRSDVDTIETQQTLECSSDAHGLTALRARLFQHSELWPRTVRVTRTPRTPTTQ